MTVNFSLWIHDLVTWEPDSDSLLLDLFFGGGGGHCCSCLVWFGFALKVGGREMAQLRACAALEEGLGSAPIHPNGSSHLPQPQSQAI